MNLKELSETLGLSQTTVSRALNGYPEVNEDTRRRVVQAAERYNYKPNTRAKSLATGRSMAIGHVIPISTKHEMVNPIFADFIAGAGETYSNSGYDMLLSVVNDEDEEKAYREMAMKGSVDGIIVHGPRENDPRIELLIDEGTFKELDADLVAQDPLKFVDSKPYPTRIKTYQEKTGEKDAVVSGKGKMNGMPVCITTGYLTLFADLSFLKSR